MIAAAAPWDTVDASRAIEAMCVNCTMPIHVCACLAATPSTADSRFPTSNLAGATVLQRHSSVMMEIPQHLVFDVEALIRQRGGACTTPARVGQPSSSPSRVKRCREEALSDDDSSSATSDSDASTSEIEGSDASDDEEVPSATTTTPLFIRVAKSVWRKMNDFGDDDPLPPPAKQRRVESTD